MLIYQIDFDALNTSDCKISIIKLSQNRIDIEMQNASFVFCAHSKDNGVKIDLPKCIVSFVDVFRSNRKLHRYKYTEERNIFHPVQEIVDIKCPDASIPIESRKFELEGHLLSPSSWLDWIIIAKDCELRVPLQVG